MKNVASAALCLALLAIRGTSALAQSVPVTRSGGDFDAAISFAAPKMLVRTPDAVGHESIGVTVQASQVRATGEIQWYLVLGGEYQSTQWRRYRGISLPGGAQLPGEPLRSAVLRCSGYGGCSYYEIVTVNLPDHIVKKAASEGMLIRWNADMLGSFELRIPASHFLAVDLALHPGASHDERSPQTAIQGASAAPPKAFRPASCDWPGVKQGVGACQ